MLYMCNINPLLNDLGSLLDFELPGPQDSADDTFGDCIELGDGGSDSWSQVLVFLLIPLRPDGSQTVVGHNSSEEHLEWSRGVVSQQVSPTSLLSIGRNTGLEDKFHLNLIWYLKESLSFLLV